MCCEKSSLLSKFWLSYIQGYEKLGRLDSSRETQNETYKFRVTIDKNL